MLSNTEHLDDLLDHKDKVKAAAVKLAKQLIKQNKIELARQLIARGYSHDNSKLESNVEWRSLHVGSDVPAGLLDCGIKHHQSINRHHPEFHGGFEQMGELEIAEMACDLLARSQEFATDLREWIKEKTIPRFNIDIASIQYKQLEEFMNLLLEDHFRR